MDGIEDGIQNFLKILATIRGSWGYTVWHTPGQDLDGIWTDCMEIALPLDGIELDRT